MPSAVSVASSRSIALPDLPAMEHFARAVAALLAPGDCITLTGELGAGKTTFARALIRALSWQEEDVPSPTFTLVQPYAVKTKAGECTLYHCDLYRLENASEWAELGVDEEMDQAITLIEWPEIITAFLPKDRLDIALNFGASPDVREAVIQTRGRAAEKFSRLSHD